MAKVTGIPQTAASDHANYTTDWSKGQWSANNPYANINPSDSRSWWQKFTDNLGFTNHGRSAEFQQEQLARQWESEYQLSLADREYNSESAQVSRMRAAGINPDFNGVTAGASQTANNEAGQMATPNLAHNGFADLGQAITTAMSLYSGMVGIQGNILAQDLSMMQSLEPIAKSDVVSHYLGRLKPDDISDIISGRKSISEIAYSDGSPIDADIVNYLSSVNSSAYRSKKVRNLARQRLFGYIRSGDFEKSLYDKMADVHTSRTSAASSKGKFDALNENQGITEVLSGLASVMFEADMNAAKSSAAHSKYDTDYYSNLNGVTAAQAANEGNKFSRDDTKLRNQMASTKRSIVNYLHKQSKSDNPIVAGFSSVLLMSWLALGNGVSAGASSAVQSATQFGVGKSLMKMF